MNKSELTQAIAAKKECTHKSAADFLNAFVEIVIEAVGQGRDVNIIKFGQFKITERSARKAKDFKSGKTIEVPASKTVTFHAGKDLKQAVKGE